MTYEQGFTAGEHQAWLDRAQKQLQRYRPECQTEWERGYWDGYMPRSNRWAQNAWVKDEHQSLA